MPLTPPDTISPGRLVIDYVGENGIQHSAGFNFVVGHFATSRTAADVLAAEVAEQLGLAMPAQTYTAIRWRVLAYFPDDKSYEEVWAGGFLEPQTGQAGPFTGIDGARSVTMTLGGRGENPDVITQAGETFLRLYTGEMYPIPPGSSKIPVTTSGFEELETLAAYLTAQEDIWADTYGQKAIANDYVTPQVNAHWQKKIGL